MDGINELNYEVVNVDETSRALENVNSARDVERMGLT
jgi:hypothetical protein